MKKIIFIIIAFASIVPFTNIYAATWSSDWWVKVEVTEKIPWANCVPKGKLYECSVQKGFWTVVTMLWDIIEYFTYVAWLGSVLWLIINWIIYSMSWLSDSKAAAKKRITDNLLWIVLLLLSWPILFIIAPWIFKN